jgi:hypothetical protein
MKEDQELSREIELILKSLSPKVADISFALIDLSKLEPEIAGYNMNHFIYPASVYKVFIVAEILRQIDHRQCLLTDLVEVKSPNDVDRKNPRFLPESTHRDCRPLLRAGDRVTIDYLIDLMLTRSDNTAANVLLDIAGRENINKDIILPNGWQGSEVTRKFLERSKEEEGYRMSRITVSNARQRAELFYKIETNQLVNKWVSNKLKGYMMNWNRDRKSGLNISEFTSYYRKGGWLEINGYKWNIYRGIESSFKKGYAVIKYSHDVGVVTGKYSHYVIALLTITKSKWPWSYFPMKLFARKVHSLMESRALAYLPAL